MKTAVVHEKPALILRAYNPWAPEEGETIEVTWAELKAAQVGTKWSARDHSNCARGRKESEAVVVYKDDHGAAVLIREWGTTNEECPTPWSRVELIWFEFHPQPE